jgi:uncharacterized protein YaiI (UPF0178 family)
MNDSTSTEPGRPTIWVDGDAVPKACKEVVFKAGTRVGINVVLVANHFQMVPKLPKLRFVQVGGGMDVADDYIAEHCQPGDLVLTADIPLAARVIEAGGTVLRFRGEELTEANVRDRLAMRDFMDDLRGGGVLTGGPPPYAATDKQRFANALDRWLSQHR